MGAIDRFLAVLGEDLLRRGKLSLTECYIDETHAGAKKASAVGSTRRRMAAKIMVVADCDGLPIAAGIASGESHESQLVKDTIKRRATKAKPKRLIGDKAYDSDPLDLQMRQMGIEMISPHQSRKRLKVQDGRILRRY